MMIENNLLLILVFCMLALISYLFGSITFGYFAVKFIHGVDIKTMGSKNVGATNLWRNNYKSLALLTFLFDALKATFSVLIGFLIINLIDQYLSIEQTKILKKYIPTFCGAFSIIGHLYSIFLKFKGGKGVSSFFGFLIIPFPYLLVYSAILWIIVFALKKTSSLSSLSVMIYSIFYAFIFVEDNIIKFILIALSLIIIFSHKKNIINLLKNPKSESLSKSKN